VCGSDFPDECGYSVSGIYTCGEVGTTPIFDHLCSSGTCNKPEGHCDPGKCDCTRVGPICGSTFPEDCGYTSAAVYTCDEIGAVPQIDKTCKSKVCLSGETACGEDPCICKAPGRLCGITYPDICGLLKDTIYSCFALKNETIPNPKEHCPTGCVFGADKCNPTDPCLCNSDGQICGSSFPGTCGINKDALYDCKTLEKPVHFEDCIADTCLPNTDTCTVVDDSCLCKEAGLICGSTFPSQCKTDRSSLYKCSGEGSQPIFESKCPSGACPMNSDKCSDLKVCTCEKAGNICGSTFDETCGYAKGTLYSCDNAGDNPILKEECETKLCLAGDDKCSDIDRCSCTRTGQICGSAFDPECPVSNTTLYYCSDEGDPPKLIEGCYTNECLPDADECTPDPCLCTEHGSTCGSNFPEHCKLSPDALYYCPNIGVRPTFAQNCDINACPVGQKTCTPRPAECSCSKPGQLCGSTFPESCRLNKDSLYFCEGDGAKPRELETCKAGTCPSGAITCERLLDCYCKGPGRPCGKTFPAECLFEPDTQYQCSNAGDTPIPIASFAPGTCGPEVDPYIQDPCHCSGTGTVCGSVLKLPSCPTASFKNGSIYRCVNNRPPVELRECNAEETCTQMGSVATCQKDPCACKEEGATVCGSAIDPSCGAVESTASYVCSGGKLVKKEDCPKGCLDYEGLCVDNCVCEKNGMACGSIFTGCNLDPNTLYLCQKGKRPTKVRDCHPSSCKVNALSTESLKIFAAGEYTDTCDINPCFCDSDDSLVCGDKVNPICKFDATALISCPGDGGKPIIVKNCDPSKCISKDGVALCDTSTDPCRCSSEGTFCGDYFPEQCRFPSDSVYSCSGKDKLPLRIATCYPQKCISKENDGLCEPDPCVCSNDFPKKCGYQADTVMVCGRPGHRPTEFEVCTPDKCTTSSEGGRCNNNPCLCNDQKDKICGSVFPEKCELNKDALYTCRAALTKPELISNCERDERCDSEGSEAQCVPNLCHCYTNEIGKKKCGSDFPKYCFYDNTVIYSCNVDDTEWAVSRSCGSDNQCIPAASDTNEPTCSQDECLCKAGDVGKDLCGSNFPTRCSYPDDSVLTCKYEGEAPEAKEMCTPNKCIYNANDETAICKNKGCASVCIMDAGQPKCKSTPCQCNEEDITLCGTDFVKDCGYDDNTIFTCSGEGSTPVFQEKCPMQCVHSLITNTSRCIGGVCDCPRIGAPKNLCGALFPQECNYDNNTLYHCETSGETPTVLEKCTESGKECTIAGDKAQSCVAPDCGCRAGNAKQCGADFLPSCGKDPKIVYSCKDPKNPVVEATCQKDCIPSPVAHCEEDKCACKEGVALMCSSEFPVDCGYTPDSVYSCQDPKKPTKTKDCTPNKCVSTPDPQCFEDKCACKSSQSLVCGSDFPPECTLQSDATCADAFPAVCGYGNDPAQIFRCSGTGSKPSESVKCKTQCIPNVFGVSAMCKPNPCECTMELVGKKLCASQFLAICGLSEEMLYYCGALGDSPTEVGECKSPSVCEVKEDIGSCVSPTDPCKCPPNTNTICGSKFESKCGLEPDTVYDCMGREGQTPSKVEPCTPQACVSGKDSATCEKDPCRCTAAKVVICGSTLPSTCGYEPNNLYLCADVGSTPIDYAKCDASGCDATTSACKTDPCACTSSSSTCGSTFKPECKLKPDVLYSCKQVGAKPVEQETCTAGCTKGASECNIDPCVCSKAELKCGSAFDPSCKLDGDTLYECTAKGDKPKVKELCGAGKCPAGTTACVKDPCKCGTASSTCGGDFADTCGFDKDTIYQCTAEGAIPSPGEKCAPGLCASADKSSTFSVAICKPDCSCKSTKDTCGIDFPTDCKLDKDTLYSCAKIGDAPKPKEVCSSNGCKTGTNTCYVDPCACKQIGEICGKDICPTLKPDTIYICSTIKGNAIAKPGGDCPTGNCNGGRCGADTCVCTQDGPFCGNELPCPGLNPDLYYSCGIGKKPFPFDRCKNGKPTTGKCLCNDGNSMCSTYFPFECGYDQSQIFKCPGGAGTKPVTAQQCGEGRCTLEIKCDQDCLCQDDKAKCGKNFDAKCNYQPGSIYTCSGKGATPVEGKACGGPELCDAITGVGRCFGECKCKTYEPVCGAAFPESCKFNPGSIYQCDFGGADPTRPMSCPIPCNPQHGPDKCGLNLYNV
ncbi:hypothetical protein BGZ95_000159, partial [Linnemannia exigua]